MTKVRFLSVDDMVAELKDKVKEIRMQLVVTDYAVEARGERGPITVPMRRAQIIVSAKVPDLGIAYVEENMGAATKYFSPEVEKLEQITEAEDKRIREVLSGFVILKGVWEE
jgi:hypothetical protein